jgi:Na+/proline symporter
LQLPPDYLDFFPKGGTVSWLNYLAAWITIGLGSIPGQDIYQRVMSSRNERVAVASAWLAGLLYLTVGMLPLLLATYLRVYQPDLVFGSEDPQRAIPEFVLSSMPPWVALLFLGALFSAVLSTASGGLLAPAAIVSENLIGARLPKYRNGAVPLWLTRVCVLGIALLSLLLGGWQGNIHHLVAESSALSLVSLFAILTLGLFARRAPSPLAALASMVSGMLVYGLARWVATDINPLIYGFVSSWLAIWTVGFWTPKQATVSQ